MIGKRPASLITTLFTKLGRKSTVIRFFFVVKIFSSPKNVRKYFTRIKFNMKYFITNI